MICTAGKLDYGFVGLDDLLFEKGSKQGVKINPAVFELALQERSRGLDLILITRSKKLMAFDPPGALPDGHYMKFESLDDPAEYLLFSRSGKVYRVKRQDLRDAVEQGYVKA